MTGALAIARLQNVKANVQVKVEAEDRSGDARHEFDPANADALHGLGLLAQQTGQFALAVDLMTNTAVTGATFDIDGGQQLVEY